VSKRVENLEKKLEQARRDAERSVRLRPLRALVRRLVQIDVVEADRETVAEMLAIVRARIEEIER